VLEGILFVLTTGCGWHDLPRELGCGSGNTAWRRLREWQAAGVWDRLHQVVLDRLGQQGLLDWSRACIDGVAVRAKRGAISSARTP
jgi:transposase